MEDLGTIFSLSNWPGHLSYLLIAISYWLTDIFWLRVVAVVGLSLEIVYFWHSGGDLRTGIGWDLIFIAINLYQLYRLAKDRLSLRLPEADRDLLRSAFSGLDNSQIARLLVAESLSILPAARRWPRKTGRSIKTYSSALAAWRSPSPAVTSRTWNEAVSSARSLSSRTPRPRRR